jgi:hypothetical protein
MPFLFWLEISLYCIMMVEMSLIIVIFLRKIGRRGPFIACFAATIGLSINLMCLVLLVVAETKRCCSETGVAENYFFSEYAAIEECCPKFGRRLFNGLGIIEPFTLPSLHCHHCVFWWLQKLLVSFEVQPTV